MSPTAGRCDAEILAEARQALETTSAASSETPLRVSVADSMITVSGNAATSARAAEVCARLRQIPGVRGVVDCVVDDDSLKELVSAVIAGDGRASNSVRKTHVVMGNVYVDWSVREVSCEHALREALVRVPGVRVVVHGDWSRLRDTERARSKASPSRA